MRFKFNLVSFVHPRCCNDQLIEYATEHPSLLSFYLCLSVCLCLSLSRFLPVGCRGGGREGRTTSAVFFFVSGILGWGRTVGMQRSEQCLFLLGCFNSIQFQCRVPF